MRHRLAQLDHARKEFIANACSGFEAYAASVEPYTLEEGERRVILAALKAAIRKEFTQPDGTLAYYKDRHGKLMPNRSGYATAFAVIFGIVEGAAARAAYAGFPTPDNGIPLFFPFIADTDGSEWHNHASWPFCVTFFLWGKSIADGKDYTDYNAALLARSVGTAIKPKKAPADQAEADAFWASNMGFGILRHVRKAGFKAERVADGVVGPHALYMVRLTDPQGGVTLFGVDQASFAVRTMGFMTPKGWHERQYDDFVRLKNPDWLQARSVTLYYNGVKSNTVFRSQKCCYPLGC